MSGATPSTVMAGLDPAIHGCSMPEGRAWMPGTRPGMTARNGGRR